MIKYKNKEIFIKKYQKKILKKNKGCFLIEVEKYFVFLSEKGAKYLNGFWVPIKDIENG